MSGLHPSRPPDESTLEVWFEHGVAQAKFDLAPGADRDAVHAQMVTLLTEAATGQYWASRWKSVDLDAKWHVLRVVVGQDSDLDGAHFDGHHSKRVTARDLVDAARKYLETQG